MKNKKFLITYETKQHDSFEDKELFFPIRILSVQEVLTHFIL